MPSNNYAQKVRFVYKSYTFLGKSHNFQQKQKLQLLCKSRFQELYALLVKIPKSQIVEIFLNEIVMGTKVIAA